jgi:uracil-DNA glycosylase family 4
VRACTRCRLHETRTRAVPGEGDPSTEVMFVGEGPGMNEDREGRPFVGRAGGLLERMLSHVGWERGDVYITNVVKCRPPGNRDPEPDEMAACAPYLRRQLEVLDPAVVVTLGRHSMGRFMPGVRISQAHGTSTLADPETGATDATVFAMYHPAAALRTPAIERDSYDDIARLPDVLIAARERRRAARLAARLASTSSAAAGTAVPTAAAETAVPTAAPATGPSADPAPTIAADAPPGPTPPDPEPSTDQLSLF